MDAVATIESRFGISLKRVSGDEYAGPCPWCGGDNRFRVWQDKGNYYCRPGPGHCGKQGFIDQIDGVKPPTDQEVLERRVAELERQQRELERRTTALEQMHRCTDHLAYHHFLEENPQYMEYWLREGITTESIKRYRLGYCASCPTYRASPSYTIPFVNRGELVNIRHRLAFPNGTGKYRPHMAGLGNSLFNVDLLDQASRQVIVCEGEKKSIVLGQYDYHNVGICGKRAFKREWLAWFDHVQDIVVALDPDATESAYKLAAMFGKRARVVAFPYKVDDMIVQGATRHDIEAFVKWARPVA